MGGGSGDGVIQRWEQRTSSGHFPTASDSLGNREPSWSELKNTSCLHKVF